MMENLAPLRLFPAFSHFSEEFLAALDPATSQESFPTGARIFSAGDPSTALFCVLDGAIRTDCPTPHGPFTVGLARRGELVGDGGFVDGQKRGCDARSERDSRLLILGAHRLRDHLDRHPERELPLQWTLWKSLSGKLRSINDLLARFFGPDDGAAAVSPTGPAPQQRDSVHLEIGAKRSIFEEQKLSPMEINFLASLSREARYRPGELIFGEGEPGDAMYVVLEGQVMISKLIPGAGEEALDFLSRGDYFGEMALIDHQPRSAQANACDDGAVVLAIPKDVVEGILDIHKVSSVRLLKLLCKLAARRLRQSEEKLVGWYILAGSSPASLELRI